MIRVLVNGALGRMGGEVCKKVFAEPDLELVGAVDIKEGTIALGEGVPVSTDLVAAIEATKPQVVVEEFCSIFTLNKKISFSSIFI